jgi:hypothetical protein
MILGPESVREIDAALIAVYAEYTRLRQSYPAARRISRPGIPAIFSESLVAHASPLLFGRDSVGGFGGKEADLLISMSGGREQLVEVKATGSHAWQEIKDRDLVRDVLVWIAFGRRYELGRGSIEVYLLPKPNRYRPPRPKLTLSVFLQGAAQLRGFEALEFDDVDHLLSAAEPSLLDPRRPQAVSLASGGRLSQRAD